LFRFLFVLAHFLPSTEKVGNSFGSPPRGKQVSKISTPSLSLGSCKPKASPPAKSDPSFQSEERRTSEIKPRDLKMNIGQMKDASTANGGGGNGGNGGATTTIPSLKRTLSGGASSSAGHTIGVGPPNLATHLGAGMNSIPSVLHASSSSGPPQMMRAVTASGVYNRPGSNLSGGQAGGAGRMTAQGGGGGAGGGATSVPTMTSRSVTQSSASTMQDWRMYLTIEERQAVRSKIRDAYSSRCMSYDDLLQVVRPVRVCASRRTGNS
jgi:hypothetical protein